ncbi:bile salt-activated lipase-like isoform X4 [Sipha flava]|uniref:Carboxylic ester hydrolase n=1 Tax=Sipha flava TaxID=143950 RepID=A0A8B8F806_9HEMI|nr:bile salt-activated lipase-like isoform X4 [Sipha flava]
MSEILSRALFRLGFVANIAFNKLIGFLSRNVPRNKMKVTIEQGTLQGLQYNTKLSYKPYVSFLGIPYAKPPIDDLRFKPPVKHPGWSGVLNAFSEGEKCLQFDILTNRIVGSENCLYLNIFVPQDELNEKLAVMLFIHGGAFNFGSASLNQYCPDYLLDENVIVVTINYRLNVLGFLNLDVDECPGNMGLKDQLFAIKWVKNNISAFGGDTDNITIFGESAGSASVHCHLLSPQSLDFQFVPSVESNEVTEKFLSAHPQTLVEKAARVPIITGVNQMEGLVLFVEHNMKRFVDFHKSNEINKLFKNQYSEEIINKIRKFYFDEVNMECEITRLENICHLYSDAYFIRDFHGSYEYLLKDGSTPVYNYEFKFDGEINLCKHLIFNSRPSLRKSLKGACHADELNYLFYGQLFGYAPKTNSPESRMCKTMSKLWANFAKTGNPNSPDSSVTWNSTSADDPKYLSLDGDNTCMVNELLYSSRVKFWDEISEMVRSE